MSVSIFESIPDKTLFMFIKFIMEEVDFYTLTSSQDDSLRDGLESAESTLGIRGSDSSLDCDYIYNVWNMNEDLFEEDKLTQPFKKPTLNKVKFTWYTWETQWAKLTYKHEIETYGSTKEDIHSYIDGKRQEGDLSPWDGDFVDTDTYDSETTDNSIDDNSITIL
jgi:hypothetical protein